MEAASASRGAVEAWLSAGAARDGATWCGIGLRTSAKNGNSAELVRCLQEGQSPDWVPNLVDGRRYGYRRAWFREKWAQGNPLLLAARGGHSEVCLLLLAAGAHPNPAGDTGPSPCHSATGHDPPPSY